MKSSLALAYWYGTAGLNRITSYTVDSTSGMACIAFMFKPPFAFTASRISTRSSVCNGAAIEPDCTEESNQKSLHCSIVWNLSWTELEAWDLALAGRLQQLSTAPTHAQISAKLALMVARCFATSTSSFQVKTKSKGENSIKVKVLF